MPSAREAAGVMADCDVGGGAAGHEGAGAVAVCGGASAALPPAQAPARAMRRGVVKASARRVRGTARRVAANGGLSCGPRRLDRLTSTGYVPRMVAAARKRSAEVDTTIYPESDDLGEGELQRLICELLRPLLARFLAARGETWHVGADQFIYWQPRNSSARIAPDIYALRGVPQAQVIRSWKVWETGIAPAFALEIVSHDAEKDYEDAPSKYATLGVEELAIFDPEAGARLGRARWQVYRRIRGRSSRADSTGARALSRAPGFASVEVTNGDRVRSKALGCWLVAVSEGDGQRVRIGTGPRGDVLVPTDEEQVAIERAARIAAEAEVGRLRAELAKRKR